MIDKWRNVFNRHPVRTSTLLFGLFGGIGGMLVDFDHFLWWVTSGETSWDLFHTPMLFVLCFGVGFTLFCGLATALFLGNYPLTYSRRLK